MSSKGHMLQEPFLNALRKERIPVAIYLVNGIKLQGHVESFRPVCCFAWKCCKPASLQTCYFYDCAFAPDQIEHRRIRIIIEKISAITGFSPYS